MAMPLILLLAAGIMTHQGWQPVPLTHPVLQGLPYFLLACSALLAWQFKRSRVVWAALIFVLIFIGFDRLAIFSGSLPAWWQSYLPLALTLVMVGQDRGVISSHGALRLGALIGLAITLYLWQAWIFPKLAASFSLAPMCLHLSLGGLSCGVSVSLMLAILGAVVIHSLERSAVSAVLCAGQLMVSFLIWNPDPLAQPLLFSALGTAILLSLVLEFYQMAFKDELTEIPSRRALNRYSLTLGRKYCVVMLDVDHFKKFNDTYGHDVGDQVLKLVASRMAKATGGCKFFRYGGEEFTLVYARKEIAEIKPHIEALREAIANYDMVIRSEDRPEEKGKDKRGKGGGTKTVNVTISLGVAERTKDLVDFDQVMKAADEALYRAKKAGRNCVSL